MAENTVSSKLAGALLAAQKEMKNPGFDKVNPHFKSRYASLAVVRETVIPVFHRHGISVVQKLLGSAAGIGCETVLIHESGESLSCGVFEIPTGKADAQAACAASTYARRFTLQAVAGVVSEEDDDGETAVGRGRNKPAAKDSSDAEREAFPPTSGPIGKPPSRTSAASEPPKAAPATSTPPKLPALSREAVAGMDMKALANQHAARYGAEATLGFVDQFGGDRKARADKNFGITDPESARALHLELSEQIVAWTGGGK